MMGQWVSNNQVLSLLLARVRVTSWEYNRKYFLCVQSHNLGPIMTPIILVTRALGKSSYCPSLAQPSDSVTAWYLQAQLRALAGNQTGICQIIALQFSAFEFDKYVCLYRC